MTAIASVIRVAVVDDHIIFRDGVCRLLSAEPGLMVVAEAGRGAEAAAMVERESPDILLLDLALGDMSGLDVLRALDLTDAKVRVILLTGSIRSEQVLEALQLGARGLVLKESPTAMLVKSIRCVMQGQYWFGHEQLPNLVEALRRSSAPPPPSPADTLTTRELRVIAAVVEGRTNRDIAQELGISAQTVKNHLTHIFDKLGVSTRLELALYAIERKLHLRDPFLDAE
jgi:DNA-binding NarL/FixJ family response regulator